MGIFRKKDRSAARRPVDIRVSESFKKGNIVTRLSFFLYHIGNGGTGADVQRGAGYL